MTDRQIMIPGNSRRRFNYERRLLPNAHIAALEPEVDQEWLRDRGELERLLSEPAESQLDKKRKRETSREVKARLLRGTEHSMGYPSWNLLYYILFSSLPVDLDDIVVVETGTNRGVSTIVMAQALKDLALDTVVQTVDCDEGLVATARANVEAAGLGEYVRFHVEDSLAFLSRLTAQVDHIDFAFIDDQHSYGHVVQEISLVCPKVLGRRGKIYFDNTSSGGAAEALRFLRRQYGGHLVQFDNCSGFPPGNAVWQPD